MGVFVGWSGRRAGSVAAAMALALSTAGAALAGPALAHRASAVALAGARVTLPASVPAGTVVSISGRVKWAPGEYVALQQKRGSRWSTLVSVRVRRHPRGRFSLHWRAPATAQSMELRVVVVRRHRVMRVLSSRTVTITIATSCGAACQPPPPAGPGPDTQTQLSCFPTSVLVSQTTACTATVTALKPIPYSAGGTVTVYVGGTRLDSCSLTSSAGTNVSTCQVDFTPYQPGSYQLSAAYGGDNTHDASQSGTVTVTASNVMVVGG